MRDSKNSSATLNLRNAVVRNGFVRTLGYVQTVQPSFIQSLHAQAQLYHSDNKNVRPSVISLWASIGQQSKLNHGGRITSKCHWMLPVSQRIDVLNLYLEPNGTIIRQHLQLDCS